MPPPGPISRCGQHRAPPRLAGKVGEGFAGRVAARGAPLTELAPPLRYGALALFGFPLSNENEVVGVLVLASKLRRTLDATEERLVATLARAAAAAISAKLAGDIAARRSAELDAVIESIPATVMIADTEGLATRLNRAACEMTGLPGRCSELLVHADELRERLQVRALDSGQQISGDERLYVRALRGEGPVRREVLLRPAGASEDAAISASVAPVWLAGKVVGVVLIGVDVTARHVAEKALRAHADQQAAVAALGRFALASADPSAVRELGERILRDTPAADGDGDRNFREAIAHLVSASSERGAREADLAHHYAEERAAVRTREEVLAVVSHDLRSPLSTIQMSVGLLRRSLEDPSAREHLARIERAAERMRRLIRDLLDMASIRAGRLAIVLAPESAEGLVREVIELHEPAAREKGLSLRAVVELEGAPELRCDRERMLQVFSNLVGNAIKFCDRGASIVVRASYDARELRFEVEDTGPGIAEGDRARVFDRYWSAEDHASQGSGLGLFIANGIVLAHGGRMGVESTLGSGTTFWLTLPRPPPS